MPRWTRLDLRSAINMPLDGCLVALRMVPKTGYFKPVRHEIGYFKSDEFDKSKSKKLWWHHGNGTDDPARMKKQFDIWWCPQPPFDGV